MSIFVVWEVFENLIVGHKSFWSPVVQLDIFFGIVPSIIVGFFAILMYQAIAANEVMQKDLRQRNNKLITLYTLVTQINQTHNLDKILSITSNWVLQLPDVEGVGIWLKKHASDSLTLKAYRGLNPLFFEAVPQETLKNLLSRHLAKTGQPLVTEGIAVPSRAQKIQQNGAQSCIYVPIWTRSEAIGVLGLYSGAPQESSCQDDNLLTAIASQVGAAIERTQLYHEMHQQITEISILHYIAFLTSSSLELDQMLQTIIQTLSELFEPLSFIIYLLEEQNLVLRAQYESASTNFAPPDTKLCRQAASTDAVIFIANGKPTVNMADEIQEMAIPLKMKDAVLGILNIRAAKHHNLEQADIAIFQTLANQISAGIHNAQLYNQVKTLNQQLQGLVMRRTQELEASQLEVTRKAYQLQQLLAEVTHIQDEERSRIAFDMHDGLSQLIIGALFESQAAEEALSIKPELTQDKLHTVQNLLQHIKNEIRRIIHDLHPPVLDQMGLAPAVKRYVEGYQQLVGVPCQLNISGQVFRLESEVETAVYRVVQEAMHNIGKHARAESARISLDFGLKNLKIIIQDDGQGFIIDSEQNLSEDHLGLIGMKRRTRSIGGQMDIQSTPGQGTKITLSVPKPTFD